MMKYKKYGEKLFPCCQIVVSSSCCFVSFYSEEVMLSRFKKDIYPGNDKIVRVLPSHT